MIGIGTKSSMAIHPNAFYPASSSGRTLNSQFPMLARQIHFSSLRPDTKELKRELETDWQRLKSVDTLEVDPEHGVFSFEKTETGKRTFVRANLSAAYEFLKFERTEFSQLHGNPHLYEVITVDNPCHLYFDVEFLFQEHPDWDGDGLVSGLISCVDAKLLEVFGQDEYELIHLDATSPNKFSRHLIFRSHLFCFKNNRHVQTFVEREILSSGAQFVSIIDRGVYSKNRNFRCIWATKRAKKVGFPLRPIDGTNPTPRESSFEYFKRTLITHVGENPHLIGYPEEQAVQWSSACSSGFLTVPDVSTTRIEEFAIAVFAPKAAIGTQRYSHEFNTLCLTVRGSRFCRNIGREHKSNGVYLVCRLQSGVIVQKCFDPDCRAFESAPVQIPLAILDELRRTLADREDCATSLEPKKVPLSKIDFLESDSDVDSIE
jgi:hypothetical protein